MNFKEGDICPVCGRGKLFEHRLDVDFTYKKVVLVFENVLQYTCPYCAESFLDSASQTRISDLLILKRAAVDNLRPEPISVANLSDEFIIDDLEKFIDSFLTKLPKSVLVNILKKLYKKKIKAIQ